MKTLIAISALTLGTTLGVQSPAPAPRGLTKAAPPTTSPAPQNQVPQTLDAWIEQLTDSDLAARERTFDRLVAAARRDASLRRALHDWSVDTNSGELAWTARLALRELDAARNGILGMRAFEWPGLDLQGFNPQGFDLSQIDPATPFNPDEFFQQFAPSWPVPNDPNNRAGAPGNSGSSIESFSLSMGPDGVKCTVKRNIDGKEDTQEYSAESIDKLLEAHPELRDKLHGGDDLGDWSFGGPGHSGQLLRVDPFGSFGIHKAPGATPEQPESGAPDIQLLRTDILGVAVQPLSEAETVQFDLDAGVGLRIERVEPNTIARSMGLQRGHVLVEMNGRQLKSRDDITEELKKRGADGQVQCIVIDRWGQRRTHTWKPDPARQL
jgi:hypothetical protein